MSRLSGEGKSIGLALGGGGVRGVAHIGIIKALVDSGFKIGAIAGTSAGALVGALFASGCSPEEILELYEGIDPRRMYGRTPQDGPSLLGVYGINQILSKKLGSLTFDQLRIPFCCPAVDHITGQEVIIHQGCVQEAVLASSAMPGIFPPRKIAHFELIDGGVLDPVPVQAVRWLAPELPVVAAVLSPVPETWAPLEAFQIHFSNPIPAMIVDQISHLRLGHAFQIFTSSVDITSRTLTELRLKTDRPDVILRPEVGRFPVLGDVDPVELVLVGEQEVRKKIPEVIRACRWQSRFWRRLRKPGLPGALLSAQDEEK